MDVLDPRRVALAALGAGLLGFASARGTARDFPLNPDQRPSYGLQLGGTVDRDATQDIRSLRTSLKRDTGSHTLTLNMDLLFPLSDSWSFQAGGGFNSQKSTSDEIFIFPAASVDSPIASGFMNLRHYFLDCCSELADAWAENPDRWPSLAFSVSGSGSIYREEVDTLLTMQSVRPLGTTQNIAVGSDLRVPLGSSLSFLAALSGTFALTVLDETSEATGNETRTQSLSYSAGFRYYAVRQTWTGWDVSRNPDRWPSVSLVGAGTHVVGGHYRVSRTHASEDRDVHGSGATAALEFRYPVSNHYTWRFGANGGILNLEVPASRTNVGSFSRNPYVGGFAGIRCYF